MFAYKMRKGDDIYGAKYEIVFVVAHPKYNGNPACGYDYAICFIGKSLGGKGCTEDNYSFKPAI